jgi:hypothetical protein
VQTTPKHGKTWNQDGKIVNRTKERKCRNTRRTRKKCADKTNYKSSDEIEKHEQPEFLATRTAREASVFLCETVYEVVHVSFVLFVLSGTMPDG